MAESQDQQLPHIRRPHPDIVYRGVLLATLDVPTDSLQRGPLLQSHIPWELIDLPREQARSVAARTLRFRAANILESWKGDHCIRMEHKVGSLLPRGLASPGSAALFLPRTPSGRVSLMDVKCASHEQYDAVLSRKEQLLLSTFPQGRGSVRFEFALQGPNLDDDIFVIQVSNLPDSVDKLAEFERVALRVGVILDLWKQVRSTSASERPTGTYIAVVRLYPLITDVQIGELPGWLVCDNPYQGYVLSYSGRRPWCNHCNWQVRSDQRHTALNCPVIGEAATERKKERSRQKRQRRRLRTREQQQSPSVERSDGIGSGDGVDSTVEMTGNEHRRSRSSTIVEQ